MVVMELAIEYIRKLDNDIIDLGSFKNKFFVLTANGDVYRFDGKDFKRVIVSKLKGTVTQHSWNIPHMIGSTSVVGNSTIIQLIDLRSQKASLLEANDKVAGVLTTSKGLIYWGGGIIEGYLGLFTGDNSWRVKTKPIQALTYDEHDEKIYIATLTGLLTTLDVNKPTNQEALMKIQGRVIKIMKHEDSLILMQPDKISVINISSRETYPINIRPRTLNLSKGVLIITTEGDEVVLRDLGSDKSRSIKVNEVYKVIQRGDEVYVIAKDKVIRIIGNNLEEIPLEGLPASYIAVGNGVALSLFNIFMHGVFQPPKIDAKVELSIENEEPVYNIEVNVRGISSLTPIKNEELLIETNEGITGIKLNDEGKATIRLSADKQAKVKITLKQFESKPTMLNLPSLDKSVVEGIRLTKGDRLLTDGGEFIIQEKLGSGGFGVVYRAYSAMEDRYIAVKLFFGVSPGNLEPILDEVGKLGKLSARLNTDRKRVIELYGFHEFRAVSHGQKKGRVYGMVMEYADGGSLRSVINSNARFNERMRYIILITEALAKLHEAGVIHGDLKPENILIKGGNPLLADFGISRIFKHVGEFVTAIGYTYAYAAPEATQKGIISEKSDVYSIGTMMIETLTGDLPAGQSTNIPIKTLNKLSQLDKGTELIELISRMRSEDPNNRPHVKDIYASLTRLYPDMIKGL